MVLVAACRAPAPAAPVYAPSDAERVAAAQRFRARLEAAGYRIQLGELSFFRVADCRELDHCYGNNPDSPYGLFRTPPFPEDDTSPVTTVSGLTRNGMLPIQRLRPGDAVVVWGRAPPPVRYFGYTPYLFSRYGDYGTTAVFAPVADTLNQTNLAVAATPSTVPAPFARETVLVATGDRHTAAIVEAALVTAGVPPGIVNLLVVAPERFRFGTGPSADTFMLLRVAYFTSPAAGERYMDAPPMFHVRPGDDHRVDPLPAPPWRPRVPTTAEVGLTTALDALEARVRAAFPDHTFERTDSLALSVEPDACLTRGLQCLGVNRDTPYFVNVGRPLPSDGFSVALGVNHRATGTASYSNVAFYWSTRLLGVAVIGDESYARSARRWLPDDPHADRLFVVFYARSCTDLPAPCVTIPAGFPGIPLEAPVSLAERAYLQPGVGIGARAGDLVPVRALHARPVAP